ncbi:hypothetical protein [Streptomyces sp. NPDC001781]
MALPVPFGSREDALAADPRALHEEFRDGGPNRVPERAAHRGPRAPR